MTQNLFVYYFSIVCTMTCSDSVFGTCFTKSTILIYPSIGAEWYWKCCEVKRPLHLLQAVERDTLYSCCRIKSLGCFLNILCIPSETPLHNFLNIFCCLLRHKSLKCSWKKFEMAMWLITQNLRLNCACVNWISFRKFVNWQSEHFRYYFRSCFQQWYFFDNKRVYNC